MVIKKYIYILEFQNNFLFAPLKSIDEGDEQIRCTEKRPLYIHLERERDKHIDRYIEKINRQIDRWIDREREVQINKILGT